MIDASFDAPKRLLQFTVFFRQCFTKRSYESLFLYLEELGTVTNGMKLSQKHNQVSKLSKW